jgi:hypothetical protein
LTKPSRRAWTMVGATLGFAADWCQLSSSPTS